MLFNTINNRLLTTEACFVFKRIQIMLRVSLYLISLMPLVVSAQEEIKYETEQLVDTAVVPKVALRFVSSLNLQQVQWVEEQNFNRKSYEAKAKYGKLKASIEFDTLGVFEDIEIDIKASGLEKQTRREIWKYFKSHFTKFRLRKIQWQLTGTLAELIKMINLNDASADVKQRYEIELYGVLKTHGRFFELLFEKDGRFISRREIFTSEISHTKF